VNLPLEADDRAERGGDRDAQQQLDVQVHCRRPL
jgi:hypothetical protein